MATQRSKNLANDLCTVEGVSNALEELRNVPVITEAEEMAAVRLDVILWQERCQKELRDDDEQPSFARVADLKGNLDAVLAGRSTSRKSILINVLSNEQIDAWIRAFATAEFDLFCEQLVDDVNALYAPAAEWNFRADGIIKTLRMHGNDIVGLHQTSSRKEPAMVDLKRVSDLVVEYDKLRVASPDSISALHKVLDSACKWSHDVQSAVLDNQLSLNECLGRLKELRILRPKGLVMDPTRNAVDLLIDVLSWHQLVKEALEMLAAYAEKQVAADEFSDLIADCTFVLLREGAEIIELFSERSSSQHKFMASARSTLENLAKLQDTHRPSRLLSRSKLEANPLGKAILNRLVDRRLDQIEGAPLSWMLYFAWRAAVTVFMKRLQHVRNDPSRDKFRPTLVQSKNFLSTQPPVPVCSLQRMANSGDVALLEELTRKGEHVESTIRAAVASKKDLLRGSFNKQDVIRRQLTFLKDHHAHVKSSVADGSALVVSSSLEQQLEMLIKDVSWLVRGNWGTASFCVSVCTNLSSVYLAGSNVPISLPPHRRSRVSK
jgi:hypothetical protein